MDYCIYINKGRGATTLRKLSFWVTSDYMVYPDTITELKIALTFVVI